MLIWRNRCRQHNMRPEQLRLALVVAMFLSAGLLFFNPIVPKMNTTVIFDDEALLRISDEGEQDENYQLVLKIRHDEGGLLTNKSDACPGFDAIGKGIPRWFESTNILAIM